MLKNEYNNGNYSNSDYFTLLGELNKTVWNMNKFLLVDGVNARKIQELIHKEQDEVITVNRR